MLVLSLSEREATCAAGESRMAPAAESRPAVFDGTMTALVAGDVQSLVEEVAATLPEAGYAPTCARHLMEVAQRVTEQMTPGGGGALDLIVFVLSREAWTYVSLIQVLVHEIGNVPIVVFTAGRASYARHLEALGVPVVARLPFAIGRSGVSLTPAATGVEGGGWSAAEPGEPAGSRIGRRSSEEEWRQLWAPVPAAALH